MSKILSLLLVFVMIGSFFYRAGEIKAADADLTTQQKYDALAEKGIFAGINGEAALDRNMNRAQFARVAALILGLDGIGATDTKVVTDAPFSDVKTTHWAAEEITAVKEANLMIGNGNGIFNPDGDITVQELAVVTVRTLGLEPVEDASVDGAADWAAGYVQALINAGVNFPTNYTQPATRALLTEIAYVAEAQVTANMTIKEARQIGAKKIRVSFSTPVDSTAVLSISNGEGAGLEWAKDRKSATFIFEQSLMDGQFNVTLTGQNDNGEYNLSASVTTVVERVVKIEFTSATDTVAKSKEVGIPFEAANQFGEVVQDVSKINVVTSPSGSASIDPDKMAVIMDTSSLGTLSRLAITLMHTDTAIAANKVYTVGDVPYAAKIELLGSLRSAGGQEVSKVESNKGYHVNFNAYDQYGTLMLPSTISNTVSSSISSSQISLGSVGAAPAGEPGTLSLSITLSGSVTAGNYIVTIIGKGGGSASVTFTVAEPPPVVVVPPPSVVATPTANVASGAVTSGTVVSLSVATAGATIYYTTNGDTPDTNSPVYSSAITITESMTINAFATRSGWNNSSVATFTYTVTPPTKTPLELINDASASGVWTGVDETTFADAGIADVTTSILAEVKAALETNGSTPREVSEIQSIVNSVVAKLAALALINAAADSWDWTGVDESTFADAGITGVIPFILSYLFSELNGDTWTVAEIQIIVDGLDKGQLALGLINAASDSGLWSEVSADVFEAAGVTGVDGYNIYTVQYYLELDYVSPRDTNQIQAIVNSAIQDLVFNEQISEYFKGSADEPTAATFAAAGFEGVTEDNLQDVLNAIAAYHADRFNYSPPFDVTNRTDIETVIEEVLNSMQDE